MSHGFTLEDSQDAVRQWRHEGNGLTLLTCPTPVAPVASFGVVYGVGSRNEGFGHTGATHILEHLMFKGTERFNRDRGTEIARVLQRVGAAFNATTWLDRTNYYETVSTEHLALAAEIEADRMRGALVREEDLASERTVVLNELERGENDPFDILMKGSFAHAFVEHPYHHPTIGWKADVESLPASVLRGFYDTFYYPNNATVMVAGDVAENDALELVESYFGGVSPAPAEFPRVHAREGEQRGERRFQVHRAAEVGSLMLTWHVPEGLHPDLPALSILAQILAEGVTSRLHQRLVETNLCLGVHAYTLELRDPGVLQVFATLAPGVPHDTVEDRIRDEVEGLVRDGVSDAEVARAKVQVRTDLAFHRESPAQIVAALTEAVAMGDWRRFLREMEVVAAVTADDVVRVAGTYLTERNVTVGWLVPGNGNSAVVRSRPPGPNPCFLREPFSARVEVHELPGGSQLAVLPNPHAPTVTLAGTLLAGPACVEDGRFSVASLTAAMLERGTRQHDRLELAHELEDHGLQLGVEATGSLPTTVSFSAQGLAEEMPRLSRLLIEVLREPTFPSKELEILREQVLGGLAREREETFPQAFSALTRRLYSARHPQYRRTVEVREAEVRSLHRDDLERYHQQTYGPASLRLAVVGAVDSGAVVAGLSELLSKWHGGRADLPDWPDPLPPAPAEDHIHIDDRPNLDVVLGHAGRLTRDAADFPAAMLANSCLGQSTLTSRLGVAVRDRAGLTYGIYSRFFGTMHAPGPWATFLSVSPDNLERAVALCREVIADYIAEGPGEPELEDERQSLSGAYQVGLATNTGVARELVSVLTSGVPLSHLDTYPERLRSTGRRDVVDALHRHVRPAELVVAAAGSLAEE